MSTPLVVIGAGGFGREALDVVDAINSQGDQPKFDLIGVADDNPSDMNLSLVTGRGVRFIGGLNNVIGSYVGVHFLIGIGDPIVKPHIAGRLIEAGLKPATAIHPSVVMGSDCRIGPGSIVCAGVQISTNVALYEHVHLNPGVIVGHDVRIMAHVSINPGAIISGNVAVESGALVGAGAIVLQGLHVGSNTIIGAGAVVTRDVFSGLTVKGVPAR